MPWELTALKYKSAPPQFTCDIDSAEKVPLGDCGKVREWISSVLPGIEWSIEPSLIETGNRLGMSIPESWDEDTLRLASAPRWRGLFKSSNLFIQIYGLYDVTEIQDFEVEVRGTSNPLPYLQKLCEEPQWIITEVGNDGQCLRFDGNATQRWTDFRKWLNYAVNHSQSDGSA